MTLKTTFTKAQCSILCKYTESLHRQIEDGIRQDAFNAASSSGFRIISRRARTLLAEYIEKRIQTETIVDPFGETAVFERIVYIQAPFLLNVEPPNIILLEPPRIHKKLVHKLCEFTNFSIAVLQPEFDVERWGNSLATSPYRFKSGMAQAKEVDFGDGFIGSFQVSGKGDVINKIEDVICRCSHTLSLLAGQISCNNQEIDLAIAYTGRIELSKPVDVKELVKIYDLYDWRSLSIHVTDNSYL